MEKIERTWNSRIFIESNHNLGVIFNGLKGTGKTIAAKILSNRLGIPVLIFPEAYNGLLKSKFNCYCYSTSVKVNSPRIVPGVSSFMGEVLSAPDQYGFFQTTDDDGNKCLKCLLFKHASPSLYGGALQKIS